MVVHEARTNERFHVSFSRVRLVPKIVADDKTKYGDNKKRIFVLKVAFFFHTLHYYCRENYKRTPSP